MLEQLGALLLEMVKLRLPVAPRCMVPICWPRRSPPGWRYGAGGKLFALMRPVLVPIQRRDKEIKVTDAQGKLLMMNAATIERKLEDEHSKISSRGRYYSRPMVTFQRVFGCHGHHFEARSIVAVIDDQPGSWNYSPVRRMVDDPIRD